MHQQSFVALKTEIDNLDEILKVNPFITKQNKLSCNDTTRQYESPMSIIETSPDNSDYSNLSGSGDNSQILDN